MLESRSRRLAAVLSIALGAGAGTIYLKKAATPELDRIASTRILWREIAGSTEEICVDNIRRDLRYSLNYYSGTPLPECSDQPRPLRIRQVPGMPPFLAAHIGGLVRGQVDLR